MSPNFAMAAFGLYGFFLILGIAARVAGYRG